MYIYRDLLAGVIDHSLTHLSSSIDPSILLLTDLLTRLLALSFCFDYAQFLSIDRTYRGLMSPSPWEYYLDAFYHTQVSTPFRRFPEVHRRTTLRVFFNLQTAIPSLSLSTQLWAFRL